MQWHIVVVLIRAAASAVIAVRPALAWAAVVAVALLLGVVVLSGLSGSLSQDAVCVSLGAGGPIDD